MKQSQDFFFFWEVAFFFGEVATPVINNYYFKEVGDGAILGSFDFVPGVCRMLAAPAALTVLCSTVSCLLLPNNLYLNLIT